MSDTERWKIITKNQINININFTGQRQTVLILVFAESNLEFLYVFSWLHFCALFYAYLNLHYQVFDEIIETATSYETPFIKTDLIN